MSRRHGPATDQGALPLLGSLQRYRIGIRPMSRKKLTADGNAAADVKHTPDAFVCIGMPCSPAVKSGNLLPTLRTSPGRNSLSPLASGSRPEVVSENPDVRRLLVTLLLGQSGNLVVLDQEVSSVVIVRKPCNRRSRISGSCTIALTVLV